jgi:dTDP-4-dehydrorhamnose 3,5-epimerase
MSFDDIRRKTNPKIVTRNKDKENNGFLIPILNVHEPFVAPEQWPKQIYCTVIAPRGVKGPHLHKKRWGLFTCIKGNLKIVLRVGQEYREEFSGEHYDFATIQVPAGIPAALVNLGDGEAYVLNMPSPSWHPDDQDDWDVAFDDYPF